MIDRAARKKRSMIDIRKLKELVRLMVSNDLTEIDLRDSEEQVTLRRPSPLESPQVVHAPAVAPQSAAPQPPPPTVVNGPASAESAPPAVKPDPSSDASLHAIASPMVGTFYATPEPDAPPFVQVGDHVNPNTVVCLVEAMKIFNEIKAECSGTIEKVLPKSGDAIEFGETLFLVKPE